LNNLAHKAYISCVITHTTHEGAPRRDIIARTLFLTKFTSDKPVKYKKLSEEELQLLDEELIHKSKWKIKGSVIRSVLCEQYTTCSSQLCDHCKELQNDQVFKIQLRNNPITKYIYNQEIGDLLDMINHTNMNNKNYFWVKFAELDQKGSFNNKKIFEELCQIMVQIADREQYKK
ncbi:15584_t:CDS:2, partial [Racocetra persica]